jgi:hypothetical protein
VLHPDSRFGHAEKEHPGSYRPVREPPEPAGCVMMQVQTNTGTGADDAPGPETRGDMISLSKRYSVGFFKAWPSISAMNMENLSR